MAEPRRRASTIGGKHHWVKHRWRDDGWRWQDDVWQCSVHGSAESARGWMQSPSRYHGPPPAAESAHATAESAHPPAASAHTTASYTGYPPTSATITRTVSIDPAKFTPPTCGPPPELAEYIHRPERKAFNATPAILSASEWHGSPRMNVRDIEEVRKELNANLIRAEKKTSRGNEERKVIRPPCGRRPNH